MATLDEIKRELQAKIEASRPVISKKETSDGYFGVTIKHRGEMNNLPFRDFNVANSRRSF
ncbi:hypothetical protein Xen7305DRAFT_00009070 [Xenococcus sp. PCC 7305]|nr:hypothetical protein Xen7305DRAFT_00009070 [Xenococcus sp. PCC 7305]